ncbi:MAG: hypothetical protein HRT43_06205 [Campylobacteraceae bacterium]|nr:hypothetical protein [Campylobacteraceae bacterium]
MNIYIYGNASFKSDIHKVFEHSNIKFRLDENDSIQEINTLDELRTTIENNPKEIFLIDDAKIFRKNALNQKIKFLKPNDAIEEEFIKEHEISDISINSLEELPKYIIQKLEEAHANNDEDDYHTQRENLDIQESIISIVDEAYSEEESELTSIDNEDTRNIDEENDKIQLDDELSSLLVGGDNIENDDSFEELDTSEELAEDIEENLEIDENLEVKEEETIETNASEMQEIEGEDMSDEFSELDNLNESDILAALDGLDDIDVNTIMPAETVSQSDTSLATNNIGLEVDSKNVNDIASLITQLLNNKTLEITIKVKA